MAERGSLDKMAAKESAAPGPGYYNFRSDFDLPEEGNTFTDTSFLMQLTAARKKQSAVFESRTARDSLMQDIKRKLHEPGRSFLGGMLFVGGGGGGDVVRHACCNK